MFIHKMGWPFSKVLYPKLTWAKYNTGNCIYLTFDDGPIPEVTEAALDILAQYGAKATFFCVGDNIRKHPHIFKRIQQEGHAVGNHTYNHLNGWKNDTAPYLKNVEECQQILENQLLIPIPPGKKPLFRPPYGRIARSQFKPLLQQYEIIMWDVLTGDFSAGLSPEQCLRASIKHAEPGSIVVFHDNIKAVRNMYYALPRFLEHCIAQGWTFETLYKVNMPSAGFPS